MQKGVNVIDAIKVCGYVICWYSLAFSFALLIHLANEQFLNFLLKTVCHLYQMSKSVHSPGRQFAKFKKKKKDFSNSSWLYKSKPQHVCGFSSVYFSSLVKCTHIWLLFCKYWCITLGFDSENDCNPSATMMALSICSLILDYTSEALLDSELDRATCDRLYWLIARSLSSPRQVIFHLLVIFKLWVDLFKVSQSFS